MVTKYLINTLLNHIAIILVTIIYTLRTEEKVGIDGNKTIINKILNFNNKKYIYFNITNSQLNKFDTFTVLVV